MRRSWLQHYVAVPAARHWWQHCAAVWCCSARRHCAEGTARVVRQRRADPPRCGAGGIVRLCCAAAPPTALCVSPVQRPP